MIFEIVECDYWSVTGDCWHTIKPITGIAEVDKLVNLESQFCCLTVDIARNCQRRAVSESPTRICVAHAGGTDQPPSSPRLDDVIARTAASCRCFMFRAWRRAALTRRLAKRRIDHGSDLSKFVGDGEMGTSDSTNLICSVVGLFDDRQLETLVDAVEMGLTSGRTIDCVLAVTTAGWPTGSIPPHVACCRLWRWPTLDGPESIKQMPWCRCGSVSRDTSTTSQQVDGQKCCNPFHWSRLVLPDSPPPPYTKDFSDRESSCVISSDDSSSWSQKIRSVEAVSDKSYDVDRLTDDDSSLGDVSSSDEDIGSPSWCRVSYWEMRRRVGRQFFVSTDWTNIFQDLPHGDGISLSVLQQQHLTGSNIAVPSAVGYGNAAATEDLSIKRTRAKIGRGVVVSRERDGIWLYNCSDYPVFVNSPLCTLTRLSADTSKVRRLPSGQALLVLGPCMGSDVDDIGAERPDLNCSCCGCYSVQVSFAKGWGQRYSRQFITACPCWIEIHVNHRHHHPIT